MMGQWVIPRSPRPVGHGRPRAEFQCATLLDGRWTPTPLVTENFTEEDCPQVALRVWEELKDGNRLQQQGEGHGEGS